MRWTRVVTAVLALVISGTVAAGCARGGAGFDTTQPCDLFTEQEVAAAVRTQVTESDMGALDLKGPVVHECRWLARPGPENWLVRVTVSLDVELYVPPDAAAPLTGLGDKAYQVTDEAGFVTIAFVRGEYLVSVHFPTQPPHVMTVDDGARLANQALERLR